MTPAQRILQIIDRQVRVDLAEIRYQLHRRGGALTDQTIATAIADLTADGLVASENIGTRTTYARARQVTHA